MDTPKAIVLLSGGLDSATALAIAIRTGFVPFALSVRYGQRHSVELQAAERVAQSLGVERHTIIDIDLRQFGGSALTDSGIDVPKDRKADQMANGIPVTYVPARNTVFLSLALAYAEAVAAFDIFIGVNALDYSGYPDCRPEFVEAFERVANLATKAGIDGCRFRIPAPLLSMSKSEIIRRGRDLGIDYSITLSCYDPRTNGEACRRCDSCQLRRRGFEEAGVPDPTRYVRSV